MEENIYISYQEINKLLQNIHCAFNVRIGIHDEQDNLLTEFPGVAKQAEKMVFCDYVSYHSKVFAKTCLTCNQKAFQIVKKIRRSYIYQCHMGFKEAMIPIYTGDTLQVVLMIGQIRNPNESNAQFGKIVNALYHLDSSLPASVDVQKLEQKWNEMLCMPDTQLEALVSLLEIFAKHIQDKHWVNYKNVSRSEQINRYFQLHYHENISIEQMSDALFISRSTLSRLIHRFFNTTFTDYLLHLRIEKAKQVLAETNLTVQEIAGAVGFKDPYYFMKVFKKLTGYTPSMYRNNMKTKI